jgi:hypothetical protein
MTKTLQIVSELHQLRMHDSNVPEWRHKALMEDHDRKVRAATLIEALYGALYQYYELTDIDVKMSGPIVRGVRRHGHAGKTLQGAFEDACQAIKLAEADDG